MEGELRPCDRNENFAGGALSWGPENRTTEDALRDRVGGIPWILPPVAYKMSSVGSQFAGRSRKHNACLSPLENRAVHEEDEEWV